MKSLQKRSSHLKAVILYFMPILSSAREFRPLKDIGILMVASLIFGATINSVSGTLNVLAANMATHYAVGQHPSDVVLGDFNGDGIPDLAVANRDSFTVSILLGRGDGTFQPAVNYFTGPNPVSIAVGDFNGDGKLDLALALLGTGTVSVLLGNGDGTFQPAVGYNVQSSPDSVAVGDFNGDGKLDIAVANAISGSVSILLGNGDGTFQAAVNYPVGTNPTFLLAVDLNKDGKLDLAVANAGSNQVSILVGKGDGTFQAAVNYSTALGASAIAVGDFNGDGKLDLAVTDSFSGNVSVLLGNGDATFQAAVNYIVESNPTSIAVTDLNGDGKPDLVVTNESSDTVSVLLGLGDGTFGPAVNWVVANGPVAVSVADFNGDGIPDLAIACSESAALVILPGLPGASFPVPFNYIAGPSSNLVVTVAAADFNGDGKPDLVGFSPLSAATTVSLLFGVGDGTFQPALSVGVGAAPIGVAAGDLNGDGKADLAVITKASSSVSVLLGNGDGTFAAAVTYGAGSVPSGIALGDFNKDGIPDICVVSVFGISVLLGNGDGTFQSVISTPVPFSGVPDSQLVVADLNGDGIPDVIAIDPTAFAAVVLLGNGDGTFRLGSRLQTGSLLAAIAVGDLNGDGKPDLVVINQSLSGTYSIFLGNGDGTFQAPVTYQLRAFPDSMSSVVVGDFDGDGKLDIAIADSFYHNVSILLGNGNGTFQPSIDYDSGAIPNSMVVADLNGDGKADIAVGMTGGISILLSSISPASATKSFSIPVGGALSSATTMSSQTVETGYARVSVNSGTPPYGTAVFTLTQNGVTVSETAVPASLPTSAARVYVEYRTATPLGGNANTAGSISVNTGIALVNEGAAPAHLTCQLFDSTGSVLAIGHGTVSVNAHPTLFISELSQLLPDFVLPANFPSTIQFGSLQIESDQPFSVLALRLTTNQRGETLMSSTPIADLSQPLLNDALFLPRLVDGGGWKTTYFLMNTSPSSTETGIIQLLDRNGAPLTVQLQNGSSGSSFVYAIPPQGVYVLQTAGSSVTITDGWARVNPDPGSGAPVGGGIFNFSQGGILVTESGVPSVLPTTHARVYIDKSGGHDTGLAIANPGSATVNVVVNAFQTDGVTPAGSGPGSVTLNGFGETAAFVGGLISGLAGGYQGVLDISSSSPFIPLTLRTLTNSRNEFLITSFPVADFNRPAPSPIVFPQIASGGGYQTEFIFISAGGAASTTVDYFGNDGSPLALAKGTR